MTSEEKAAWLIAHPAAFGRAVGYPDLRDELHGEWIKRIVCGDEDMTLQAHRGSYKTTCLCLSIALLMMRYHNRNIIFLRKTDADVAEVLANVNKILCAPVTQAIYFALTKTPLKIVRATSSELSTWAYNAPTGAQQLQGIGLGGSLTGKHAHFIITDDIVNLRDRVSRAERDRTKAVYQELQNIRNPGGRIINTGTPWHKDDAFSLMPEPIKYDCYSTGLLNKKQIDELKQSMAPSLFAANYELRHIASDGAMFTTSPVFATDEMAQDVLKMKDAKAIDLIKDGIVHIDAAYGGEDYTAFTCGRRIGETLYMYGRLWQKHVDAVLPVCLVEAKRLGCWPIHCERNGDKGYLGKEIAERGLAVRTYSEFENKHIKISTFLHKWWEKIVWLEGTDQEYLLQIMDYTEMAAHDDAPDSAACVCRYFDRRG